MDAVVQEIDVKTGLVLFEWHALDHIPISESYFKTNAPGLVYDPYHLNSISLDTDGNLIISMRNTWGVYKVNTQTGAVMWTLGTNQNQFKRGPGTSTVFQHDVLVQPNGVFTMFDDGGGPPTVRAGRAISVAVNESAKTVTLVKQYQHNPPLDTNFEGNAQELPNGDMFVGWGQQPYFTEFSAAGKQIFDARFTSNTSSYRAYRFQWTGQPTTPPSIAAGANNDTTSEVWASWNGATTVSSWRVLAGPSSGSLTQLETVPRQGFETGISASTGMPYFAVQALGSSGQVLGTSSTTSVGPHIGVAGRSAFVSSASGTGGLPALCVNSKACHIAVTLKVGRTVVASTGREDIPAEGGGLIYFTLNGAGRSLLAHAKGRRLLVYMTGQDISKLSFARFITLVPFSTRGSAPARGASQSSTLRILGLTDFVSSGGVGGLLAECLGTAPCHASTSLSVGGKTIGFHRDRADRRARRGLSDLLAELDRALAARPRAWQSAGRRGDGHRRRCHRARFGRARRLPLSPALPVILSRHGAADDRYRQYPPGPRWLGRRDVVHRARERARRVRDQGGRSGRVHAAAAR